MSTLAVYASKHGATQGIAERIAAKLVEGRTTSRSAAHGGRGRPDRLRRVRGRERTWTGRFHSRASSSAEPE
jgi:hypothetical protein